MKISKDLLISILKIVGTAIVSILATLGFTSCGVTKATISKPAEGTSTTITITTNNPISTTVSPDLNAVYNPSK